MKQHHWTDEDRAFVKRNYKGTKVSKHIMAAHLGVTYSAVCGQIELLGIAKRTHRHPWTPPEEKQLQELMPIYRAEQIAKIMHRSINSVASKATELKASWRNHGSWYTKNEVAEILGVNHHWVQSRIDAEELIASHSNGRKPGSTRIDMWHITQKNLKKFIQQYPGELNGRNVDMFYLVEILAGILPLHWKRDDRLSEENK